MDSAGGSAVSAAADVSDPGMSGVDVASGSETLSVAPFITPKTVIPVPKESETSVDWKGLSSHSRRFLAVEHAFRLATEPGTRSGLAGNPFHNYTSSVANLHGWADGDEFYVNYVGHPMQGSVAGFLWVRNDRSYRQVEFGRDRLYWKSRLRAAAFAWAYSEQFEIGLLSEASLGAIQKYPPQQGFVDHVITPTIGMAWMIGEDSVDRYVIKRIESYTDNVWARLLVRSALNPTRTFANVLGGSLPWRRETRRGVRGYDPKHEQWLIAAGLVQPPVRPPVAEIPDVSGPAPFEFNLTFQPERLTGRGGSVSCLGGAGTGAFRVSPAWQLVAEVGGCKMLNLENNVSGDSLTYMAGPRWSGRTAGPWSSYVQVLVGGQKLTMERMSPAKKKLLRQAALLDGPPLPVREEYTEQAAVNGFAVSTGGGVQYKLNRALALRLAELSYRRSWTGPLWDREYSSGLKLASGLVLRMGTW